MDDQNRFEGCLPTYHSTSKYPQVLPACGKLSDLPVQGTSIWHLYSTQGVYKDSGTWITAPGGLGVYRFKQPRLDFPCQLSTTSPAACAENFAVIKDTRVDGQLGQMSTCSLTTSGFSWPPLPSTSISSHFTGMSYIYVKLLLRDNPSLPDVFLE